MDHEGARRAHIQEEGSGVPKVNACSGLSKVFRGELPEKCEIFVKRSLLGSPLGSFARVPCQERQALQLRRSVIRERRHKVWGNSGDDFVAS